MDATLKQIGVIHSPLQAIDDCPLQESENAPEAVLEIFPDYVQGMRNLTPGMEVILLTWLHQADRTVIQCVPRREFDSPKLGVFSTRSPDRPNPVGLHVVTILAVSDGNKIRVSCLEVLDKTPVIDIKPVLSGVAIG